MIDDETHQLDIYICICIYIRRRFTEDKSRPFVITLCGCFHPAFSRAEHRGCSNSHDLYECRHQQDSHRSVQKAYIHWIDQNNLTMQMLRMLDVTQLESHPHLDILWPLGLGSFKQVQALENSRTMPQSEHVKPPPSSVLCNLSP